MIEIVDINQAKKDPDRNYVYVGRGTIFGNPSIMTDESQRDQVCDDYHEYFIERLETDGEFVAALQGLVDQYRQQGYLRLACHCAPRRCHGDTIRGYLLSIINKGS